MATIYNDLRPFHKHGMRCGTSLSDSRALALALALFAITLNFLQPLAHAAVMLDGGSSTLWSVFCKADPDTRQDAPLAAEKHECCLGLAHAFLFSAPASAPTAVDLAAVPVRPLQAAEVVTSVGIRDGPHRPRGPPSLLV